MAQSRKNKFELPSKAKETSAKVAATLAGVALLAGCGPSSETSASPTPSATEITQTIESPTPVETPTAEATSSPEQTATPEWQEAQDTLINSLEAMSYDDFIATTTPEERAVWCAYTNRDAELEFGEYWATATGNPLDAIVYGSVDDTPEEKVAVMQNMSRSAFILHFYPEDGGNSTFFDMETSRKVAGCTYFESDVEKWQGFDEGVVNVLTEHGLSEAPMLGRTGSFPMLDVVSFESEYVGNDGRTRQAIRIQNPLNGNQATRTYVTINYSYNGEPRITYMQDFTD